MTSESAPPRSRRALLAAGFGGLVAAVATVVGRAAPVRAEGEVIHVGDEFTTATSRTRIRNETNDDDVLVAASAGSGIGVGGSSDSGIGVFGGSTRGSAVEAVTALGIAVHAYGQSGHALLTENGRVRFQQVSGVATIRAGATSKTVSPVVNVVNDSFVLLTPRANLRGRDLWYATNRTANTLTIHMSSARSGPTKVGWLLVG